MLLQHVQRTRQLEYFPTSVGFISRPCGEELIENVWKGGGPFKQKLLRLKHEPSITSKARFSTDFLLVRGATLVAYPAP